MAQRPWPLKLLAAAQLLAPLINIILNSRLLGITTSAYLRASIHSSDALMSAVLLLGVPLANAACILICRPWSLLAFFSIEALLLGWNFYQWSLFPASYPFWTTTVINVLNLMLVTYFLLPTVRRFYTQKRLRWWETKPRYLFEAPLELTVSGANHAAHMLNISEGGLFAKTAAPLDIDAVLDVQVPRGAQTLKLRCQVVRGDKNTGLYGIEFSEPGRQERKELRRFMKELKKQGVPTRNPEVTWWHSLGIWLRTAQTNPSDALLPRLPDEVKKERR